jgi:hypothetical protein
MDSRTMMGDDSGGAWARGKLSLWKVMSLVILSLEHLQNDKWSKMLGKTQILPEKLIQEWRWIVNHIVIEFWYFAFCFGITSHPFNETCLFYWSFCCFEIMRCFFQSLFCQNILIELQHAIKANQSWKFKNILIAEMTRQILCSYMKLNHKKHS